MKKQLKKAPLSNKWSDQYPQLKKLQNFKEGGFSGMVEAIKKWLSIATRFTIEESRVLSLRAQEAGTLTQFNAQKYRLRRDFEMTCSEIGQQVIGLAATGKKNEMMASSKIQELIRKAGHIEKQLTSLDQKIQEYKKEYDNKVQAVHRKAA